jgi:hypothetical protein
MKRLFASMCMTIALSCTAAAQPVDNSRWTGVWQGTLNGVPSVTLTLAEDTGQLSGTLVLKIITKDDGGQPHIAAVEPHTLVNPRVEANALHFGVKKIDGSSDLLNFTVALSQDGKAQIHCMNCGEEAPTVEIERTL